MSQNQDQSSQNSPNNVQSNDNNDSGMPAEGRGDIYAESNGQPQNKYRRWVFTYFYNDQQDADDFYRNLRNIFNYHQASYIVCEQEHCPSTGREHIQGFIHFNNQRYFNGVKNLLQRQDIHLAVAIADDEKQHEYCTKEAWNVLELGKYKRKGQREDLNEVTKRIEEMATEEQIAMEFPVQYVKFYKGIRELIKQLQPRPQKPIPKVFCFFGSSGSGKSYDSHYGTTKETCFTYTPGNAGNAWWDGYMPLQHRRVVIDEMNKGFYTISYLKRLLDMYDVDVEVKGGKLPFVPDEIYITSNNSPLDWYDKYSHEDVIALLRRFNCIRYYEGAYSRDDVRKHDIKASPSDDAELTFMKLTQLKAEQEANNKN